MTNPLGDKLKQWIHNHLAQEVPDEDAVCEFGCRRTSCNQGEWEHCENGKKLLQVCQKQEELIT